jgi:flagellin-specific chaperone FliS
MTWKSSEDMGMRARQALELNDDIVQGLSVAKYALDQGRNEEGKRAVEETLKKAQRIIGELLGEDDDEVALAKLGNLRRERPATVTGGDSRG